MAADIAVLLLQMGGPGTLDDVEPFLINLFSDREIIRLGPALLQPALARWIARRRAPKVEAQYEKIGGGSPLPELTRNQAEALERNLGERFRCLPAMRYWRPTTIEALAAARREGISRIVALPLYPQYCRATTGSGINELKRVLSQSGSRFTVSVIEGFHDHPLYIDALAETLAEGLGLFPDRDRVFLLFSAHSIPLSFVRAGDPYQAQVEETVRLVMERFPGMRHELAFQSKAGPVKWLAPATGATIAKLAAQGHRNILVVPVSFVSDHIETLYEIDITFAGLAREQGVENFHRAPALNSSPTFIACLADLVANAAGNFKGG